MTLSVNKNRWDLVGNGSAGPFVYDNKILATSHLYVYVGAVLKTINTHYTVTGIGVPTGGNVTFTSGNEPGVGVAVLLLRLVPLTQLSDYVNHDSLNAETLENDLDKQVMIAQQFGESLERILKISITSTLTDIEVPVLADSFIMWNSDGTQLVAVPEWESGDPLPDHHDDHENAGADEISVAGLSGLLADDQHVLDTEVLAVAIPNSTNFLLNGDFEEWVSGTAVAPGGWIKSGAGSTIARESTIVKLGTYSTKLTRVGTDCNIYQNLVGQEKPAAYWVGKTITFGCWVYATVADRARLSITTDGTGTVSSSYHTGDSTWQFLTVTTTLGGALSYASCTLEVLTGNTAAYFDGAISIEGSILSSFSPRLAKETAWANHFTQSTIVGWSSFTEAAQILVKRMGKTVFVAFDLYGVSNSINVSFTVPYTPPVYIGGAGDGDYNPVVIANCYTMDNGVGTATGGQIMLFSGGNIVVITKTMAGTVGDWTASGNKEVNGQFWYEID